MIRIEYSKPEDFDLIYQIYGKNTDLLGRPFPAALREQINKNEMLKVIDEDNELIGFCNFHRLVIDNRITVYEICVTDKARGKGAGKAMINFLLETYKVPIRAKCVKDSTAELFWSKVGKLIRNEQGKKRELAVYQVGDDIKHPTKKKLINLGE